jgi:3-methyladenine DNA glycosylase AlkD
VSATATKATSELDPAGAPPPAPAQAATSLPRSRVAARATGRQAADRPLSPVTAAATQFVADHRAAAELLGERLAELVTDPGAFERALIAGFETIADPLVPDGIRSVTPGLDSVIGVRLPLLSATHRWFARGTRRDSSSPILDITDRLLRHEMAEVRWFAMWNLERLLATDPERTWQLMRRAAAEAHEWISVDTLAHPYGAGILRDGRRWAEIGQLVYSPSRWERRLVGSTVATIVFVKGVPGARNPAVVTSGLGLVGDLIGDAEPDVQKALSWALRNLAALDLASVTAFVEREAEAARAAADGNRAWVLRDTLAKIAPADAARLRASLDGIRRRPGATSTSSAAATAAAFAVSGFMGSPARVAAAPEE